MASKPSTRGPSMSAADQSPSLRKSAARTLEERERRLQWRIGGDRHAEEHLRPVPTQIGHLLDLPVGDGHDGALIVAQDRAAQGDVLDAAGGLSDADNIAHNVLILYDDKKSGDQVAHQILRAEADGEAREASQGRQGRHVIAKFAQRHENRQSRNDGETRAVKDSCNCSRLLLAHARGTAGIIGGRLVNNALHDRFQQARQDKSQQKDTGQAETPPPCNFYPLGKEISHTIALQEFIASVRTPPAFARRSRPSGSST